MAKMLRTYYIDPPMATQQDGDDRTTTSTSNKQALNKEKRKAASRFSLSLYLFAAKAFSYRKI